MSVGLYLVEWWKRLLFDKVLYIVRFLKIILKVWFFNINVFVLDIGLWGMLKMVI